MVFYFKIENKIELVFNILKIKMIAGLNDVIPAHSLMFTFVLASILVMFLKISIYDYFNKTEVLDIF